MIMHIKPGVRGIYVIDTLKQVRIRQTTIDRIREYQKRDPVTGRMSLQYAVDYAVSEFLNAQGGRDGTIDDAD